MFGNYSLLDNNNTLQGFDFAGTNGFGGMQLNPTPPVQGSGFGFNQGTIGLGLQGLSSIGGLWNAFQAQKLAKDQFKFTKEFANTNLNNSIKSYNTQLEDRGRSRAVVEGQTIDQAQDYLDRNRLSRG